MSINLKNLDKISEDALKHGFQALATKDIFDLQGVQWDLSDCASNCAISPACDNCPVVLLALKESRGVNKRIKKKLPRYKREELFEPLRHRRPRFYFVCPRGDLFHKDFPRYGIAQVCAVANNRPDDFFQFLTKRSERMGNLFGDENFLNEVEDEGKKLFGPSYTIENWGDNISAGVTIESQKYMWRADVFEVLPSNMLRAIWASPLLGDLHLSTSARKSNWVVQTAERGSSYCDPRPCRAEWLVHLVEQCREYGIPFYTQDRWTPERLGLLGVDIREYPNHKFWEPSRE